MGKRSLNIFALSSRLKFNVPVGCVKLVVRQKQKRKKVGRRNKVSVIVVHDFDEVWTGPLEAIDINTIDCDLDLIVVRCQRTITTRI